MNNFLFNDFFTQIIAAYKGGSEFIKRLIVGGFALAVIGGLTKLVGSLAAFDPVIIERVSASLAISGFVVLFAVFVYQSAEDQTRNREKYIEVEERAKSNPNETQASWDLARIKLESYIDRNLKQVRSIYILTLIVMLAGFSLIGFGVYTVLVEPNDLYAGVISSVSGVLVNFLGATFLVIYKSTMEQASSYVAMLERINAVGMSVQVLDKLETTDQSLKDKSIADLSQQLLKLYQKA
ncbi:TRADD-N-associated membrane domain-containing protein [Vibrio campbellii]|uniref:TRADD-N-associated membrane domain-containing protein n=1 Tax=Vibrio campbellii TaxID=680 RepID=UPI00249C7786|nr:hypothetical protein [Vibrio campbellii]